MGQYCDPNTYLGFDIDNQSLTIARDNHPKLTFTDHSPLKNQSDETFDSIFLLVLIEHVDDPSSLLFSLKNLLCEDGCMVITTPHPSFEWVHRLGAGLGIFSVEASEEHKKLLGKEFFKKLGSKSKFNIVVYERFLFGANQLIVLRRRGWNPL